MARPHVAASAGSPAGKRVARWKNKSSKWATAEVIVRPDGREVIRFESGTYFAKCRDADGVVLVVPTGCRSEDAARQSLTRLERDAERVKIGVATHAELATADAAAAPIKSAIDACVATLTGSRMHRQNVGSYLGKLAEQLNWHRPADLRREDMERWLADQTRLNRSARSRNAYQAAANSFANWCVRSLRLTSNPFDRMPKTNTDADQRRQRRALTPEELQRLKLAAQNAPERPAARRLEEKGQNARRPAERLMGQERAEVCAILVGTGIRIGELSQLRVADVRFDDRIPHIDLPARVTKNGEDDTIPLRNDLVVLLRRRVKSIDPASLLYPIPGDFIKRFNADCKRAGIPKRDERGRAVDILAMRTTFGTWLARFGVASRVAQALMRHSDIKLTIGVNTDPKLLETAAVASSPSVTLPSAAPPPIAPALSVVPGVAPTQSISSATGSSAGKGKRRSKSA